MYIRDDKVLQYKLQQEDSLKKYVSYNPIMLLMLDIKKIMSNSLHYMYAHLFSSNLINYILFHLLRSDFRKLCTVKPDIRTN